MADAAVRKNLISQGIDESYIKSYKVQIDEVVRRQRLEDSVEGIIKGIYLRLSTAAVSQTTAPDQRFVGNNGAAVSGGPVKREAPFGSQGSESKRAKSTPKVKSAATVGSDEEAAVVKKKAKPRKKKPKAEGETSDLPPNNPFNKPLQLSPEFTDVLGESQVSRPQAVKMLWAYIKEHNLQDPQDKRYIVCDEKLLKVLGEPRVHMMTMNKLLSSHFSPLPVSEVDSSAAVPPVNDMSVPLPRAETLV
ncbi:hypothetical protein QFC19_005832 [Naganishia cerealis]|uniref:Uncharacterized protein n=1 Tax=Naganishia cerealis TaxID=610337 RepID=A0ACC2VKS2_9TREE|nr:hypothetical protein QFC19_005832 [Naganishia cerealis]